MEAKTRYTMVDKRGNEIYHSDSYLGFIGKSFLAYFMTMIILMVIGLICCGIGAIFK